jgi:CheY-like chemotaxis protein
MQSPGRRTPPVILLVEDNENDAFIFRRALDALNWAGELHRVKDVPEAHDYLQGCGNYADRNCFPLPDLIVSDFHMPGHTGLEFLNWLRLKSELRKIPFVLFASSALPVDKKAVLEGGARVVLSKSPHFATTLDRVPHFATTLDRVKRLLALVEDPPVAQVDAL